MALLLDLEGHQVDPVLGKELEDLHLLVDLHVAVLTPHASIQELIEVNITVVTLDSHLQHLLLQFLRVKVLSAEAQGCHLVP